MIKSYRNFFMLIGLVVFIQILVGIGVYNFFFDWTSRGQFGDMFGVANALFSGCALAGVIYTNHLQQKALGEQQQMQERMQSEISKQAEFALLSARINAITATLNVYHSLDINNRDYTDANGKKLRTNELVQKKILELEELLKKNVSST